MSASVVAIAIEGALIAVLVLFVVALLRSHAEILRRLVALEGGTPPAPPRGAPATARRVPELAGRTLTGDAVKLALGPGSPRTLLAFLSSGCAACEPLWADLHGGSPMPSDTRLVVVTKGPDRESVSRLTALAPAGQEVVMSTAAFIDFEVPVTPHFLLVDAGGAIAGRGSAVSWQQILTLLDDADRDHRAAADSASRAARADEALAAAGVTAGHQSLYPSQRPGDRGGAPEVAP